MCAGHFLFFRRLGFCINEDKSILSLTKSIECLGTVMDTDTMSVYLPVRRVSNLLHACVGLLHRSVASVRQVARMNDPVVIATFAVTQ